MTVLEKLKPGKVREPFKVKVPNWAELFALITSNRISAFEQGYGEVNFKGTILTQITNYFLTRIREEFGEEIVWAYDTGSALAGNTTLGIFAPPVDCELIVRRYLTGSLWRKVRDKKELPWEDLKKLQEKCDRFYEYQRFDRPIFTPTYKDDENNDPPISEAELVESGIIRDFNELREIKQLALRIFEFGEELAADRGLVLVDTKFEIGRHPITGKLVIIDEVLTPDSSRYWYEQIGKYSADAEPEELSKEFVRKDIVQLMKDQGLVPEKDPSDDDIKAAAPLVKIPGEKFSEWSYAYARFFKEITGEEFDEDDTLGDPFAEDILEEYVLENFS